MSIRMEEKRLLLQMYPIGSRIKLIKMDDPFCKLEKSDEGTVMFIDDMLNIHVKWDRGSSLALLPEMDLFEAVSENSPEK